MITANDLKGIMAMMPAFTTKDGDRPDAEDTVDTAELARAVVEDRDHWEASGDGTPMNRDEDP